VGIGLPELYPLDPHCKDRLDSGMIIVIHPAIWVPGRGIAFLGGPIAVSEAEAVRLDNFQPDLVTTI
jgi:hypothetical protein